MHTLTFASPYMVPDRDAWDGLATQWTAVMLGPGVDGTAAHTRLMAGIIDDSPIPVPPPWTVGVAPVTVSYLTAPHLWFPAEWASLRCGETMASWHMRMLATCDLLGWVRHGSADMFPSMSPVIDDTDPDALGQVVAHLTTGAPSELADMMREAAMERVRIAYPDGYPVDDMIRLGHAIAMDSMFASTVMSAYTAVAYSRADDQDSRQAAVSIIRRLRSGDAVRFDVERPDPDSTAAWVRAHAADAMPLFDLLEAEGLAPEGIRDMVRSMLADV